MKALPGSMLHDAIVAEIMRGAMSIEMDQLIERIQRNKLVFLSHVMDHVIQQLTTDEVINNVWAHAYRDFMGCRSLIHMQDKNAARLAVINVPKGWSHV